MKFRNRLGIFRGSSVVERLAVNGSFQKKLWLKNKVNSGKPKLKKRVGNPEPILR